MDGVQLGEWVTAAAVIAGGAGFPAYAVRGRSSALFAPSRYRGDTSRAVLALTFDDGPSESTPALLEVLAKHGVRATFFMCGKNVRRLPEVARQVHAQGHEIGNHTDSHPRFDFKSPDYIYREIAAAQDTIQETTGVTPRLFRAPYGVRWFGLRRAQERLPHRRDVDRDRARLALAGQPRRASPDSSRRQRRNSVPARRAQPAAGAGHPRHAGGRWSGASTPSGTRIQV